MQKPILAATSLLSSETLERLQRDGTHGGVGLPISRPNSSTEVKNQFSLRNSITSQQDAAYLDAVKRGDMRTAQRMVDKAARKAGYTIKAYHGTRSKFTVFDKNKRGQSNSVARLGFWFTKSKKGAKRFADATWYGDSDEAQVYDTYLKLNNPKVYKSADYSMQIENLFIYYLYLIYSLIPR